MHRERQRRSYAKKRARGEEKEEKEEKDSDSDQEPLPKKYRRPDVPAVIDYEDVRETVPWVLEEKEQKAAEAKKQGMAGMPWRGRGSSALRLPSTICCLTP